MNSNINKAFELAETIIRENILSKAEREMMLEKPSKD